MSLSRMRATSHLRVAVDQFRTSFTESRRMMKTLKLTKFQYLYCCVAALAIVACLFLSVFRATEPAWKGHRLSEWLDAYDSHNRFDEHDGRRSPFTDEQIEQALDEMRPAALPVLLRWLARKPGRLKPRLNQLLNQQSLIGFRFEERDYEVLAETGFMAYGEEAQPVLPELLKLTHGANVQTRLLGYEAAFFTRPDKAVFLPLADRALREADPSVRAMAAQWLRERFPEEAEAILTKHD